MDDACDHYGRVPDLLREALDGDGSEGKLREAGKEAAAAFALFARSNEILPPGEAQPAPVLGAKSDKTRIDPLYSRVAGSLVDAETEVRCWSKEDWPKVIREARAVAGSHITTDLFGFTGIGSKRINLSPAACRPLDRFVYEEFEPTRSYAKLLLANSIGTLAHEAQHRKGIAEEDVAECYGLQKMGDAALSLGVDSEYTRELVTLYWAHYPYNPAEYRSPRCRNGGKLDLNPDTSRWP